MTDLVRMQFGSHVYGTNTPSSDTDYKGVFLPSAKEILLQRVKVSLSTTTKADKTLRNEASDVDTEIFSLSGYLKLLLEGQTVALDMLFTPEKWYLEPPHPAWKEIQERKDKFLHRGVASFAGYCRTQAAKYGIKGSRIAAVRDILELLKQCDPNKKLQEYEPGLTARLYSGEKAPGMEYIVVILCRGPNGIEAPHLEVCNRKVPFTAKVKYAIEVYQRIFDEYGHRARLAETNEGVDWKACMHAVRVAHEAKDLLLTHHITHPRPEAALLLKIRKGELPYKQVAELIEQGLENMEAAALISTLPDQPDREFAEKFIEYWYASAVGQRGYDEIPL